MWNWRIRLRASTDPTLDGDEGGAEPPESSSDQWLDSCFFDAPAHKRRASALRRRSLPAPPRCSQQECLSHQHFWTPVSPPAPRIGAYCSRLRPEAALCPLECWAHQPSQHTAALCTSRHGCDFINTFDPAVSLIQFAVSLWAGKGSLFPLCILCSL